MTRLRIALAASSAFLPSVVLAAPRNFQELAGFIVTILDNATAVLVVLGLVIFFYGTSTGIINLNGKSASDFKKNMMWGVLILFVMVSIWGILRLLQSTLFGGNQYNPAENTTQSEDLSGFQPPPINF